MSASLSVGDHGYGSSKKVTVDLRDLRLICLGGLRAIIRISFTEENSGWCFLPVPRMTELMQVPYQNSISHL